MKVNVSSKVSAKTHYFFENFLTVDLHKMFWN